MYILKRKEGRERGKEAERKEGTGRKERKDERS